MSTIIFVGAHPDDIELGCSGTIAYFASKGYRIICIFLTRGEACANPERRQQESIAACLRLGVEERMIYFGPFEDCHVPETWDLIDYLESFCMKIIDGRKKPDPDVRAVFIHSSDDVHQDHRAAANCCRTAFRYVPNIFAYEAPSVTAAFNPTTFVNITSFMGSKEKALKCHRTQIELSKPCLEYEAMLSLAAFRGSQFGVQCAEAFQTIKNQINS